jgi:hypothetical protein
MEQENSGVPVHVSKPDASDLAGTQTQIKQAQRDGIVAPTMCARAIECSQESLDLVVRQHPRKAGQPPVCGAWHRGGPITGCDSTQLEVPTETPDRSCKDIRRRRSDTLRTLRDKRAGRFRRQRCKVSGSFLELLSKKRPHLTQIVAPCGHGGTADVCQVVVEIVDHGIDCTLALLADGKSS